MHVASCLRTTALVILCLFASPTAFSQLSADAAPQFADALPGFEENRGQLADQFGRARDDIQYSFVSGSFRMRLKRSSLSYELVRHESPARDPLGERDPFDRFDHDPEPTTVYVHRVDLSFPGANPMPVLETDGMLPGYNNYYYGHMSEDGATFVRSWRGVAYRGLYAGTDLVLTAAADAGGSFPVKYDFVLRPGADPSDIRIRYDGATALRLTGDGALEIVTSEGTITEQAPECWAVLPDGSRRTVSGAFRLEGDEVSFALGHYPAGATLVIDPGLVWATYYGGSANDYFFDVGCDASGSVYATGLTQSGMEIATSGAAQSTYQGNDDGMLAKLSPFGIRRWGTYFGGSGLDRCWTIAVSSNGTVFIAGDTESLTGIATSGSFKTTAQGDKDGFIARFDSAGVRQFGSYFGGPGFDRIYSIALAGSNGVLFTGRTQSASGIATPGASQTSPGNSLPGGDDGMLGQLSWNGTGLSWCTYVGGSGLDDCRTCAVDVNGDVVVAGYTSSQNNIATTGAFQTTVPFVLSGMLMKFTAAGVKAWGTYIGLGTTKLDAVSTDASGNIYVAGSSNDVDSIATAGTHQTTVNGGHDAILMKFTSAGQRSWGTCFGGISDDYAQGLIASGGNIFIVGRTESTNDIASSDAFQHLNGGHFDSFIARFSASNGTRAWSTYYGGFSLDEFLGISAQPGTTGNLIVAGAVISPGLATTNAHRTIVEGYDGILAVFRDVTITPGTINRPIVCTGDQRNVPYTILGSFDTGNYFRVELSDANGSFDSPDTIGSLNATTAGTISCTIPYGTPIGTGYKVRIVSSRPRAKSAPASQTLTIRDGEPHTLAWTGASNTTWTTVGNWDNGCAAPSDSDAVIIPPGTTPPAGIPAMRLSCLTLDNAAGTQLAGNLLIVDSLVLARGQLRLGDYNLTLGPAAVLAGASDSSFIVTDGTGELRMQAIGSGAARDMALFPVGVHASSYTPLFLQNAGTADEFRLRVDSLVTLDGTPAGAPVAWNVVARSWRASEATAGGSDLTITVDWRTALELPGFDRDACFIARRDATAWQPLSAAKSAAGGDPWSLTARSVTALGTLVVGDTLSYYPVELLSFTVREAGGLALLEWTTAWETNNFGFEVQRATTDGDFDVIAFVPAGSAQGSRYTFADAPPAAGIWRYRLRQVDTDGSDSHSPEARIAIDARPGHPALLTAWPNPARDLVTVRAGATPMGDLVLRDLLGRELRRVRASILTDLPLDGLPAGLYHIEAITEAGVGTVMLRVLR